MDAILGVSIDFKDVNPVSPFSISFILPFTGH